MAADSCWNPNETINKRHCYQDTRDYGKSVISSLHINITGLVLLFSSFWDELFF